MQFHIVDVFTSAPYAGNQLAVVESGGELTGEQMQAIAAEMNYSETTFVESLDAPFPVRIFTPTDEIPFAGHPTLGTAAVVRSLTAVASPRLSLPVGEIPVTVESVAGEEILWMEQHQPTFGAELDRTAVASAIGVDPDTIVGPAQVVSTGLATIVVPVADRRVLASATIDSQAYRALVESRDAKNVLVYCTEPRDDTNDVAVRVFAPALGVPEDPATGSSNGCLAAYLLAQREEPIDLRVEQGHSLGRPSLLHLRADTGRIEVGGAVSWVASGELACVPNQNG